MDTFNNYEFRHLDNISHHGSPSQFYNQTALFQPFNGKYKCSSADVLTYDCFARLVCNATAIRRL